MKYKHKYKSCTCQLWPHKSYLLKACSVNQSWFLKIVWGALISSARLLQPAVVEYVFVFVFVVVFVFVIVFVFVFVFLLSYQVVYCRALSAGSQLLESVSGLFIFSDCILSNLSPLLSKKHFTDLVFSCYVTSLARAFGIIFYIDLAFTYKANVCNICSSFKDHKNQII